ncbi:phosphotransferase [Mesobacillus foraminis]|uniref:Phosphotransferase family enzyme n=1 Tax=Mesobacillus foraminis TaxID=279826 RepID=A0A4V2RCD6_9BACI|nr:phosphotransferase [Mesobacillus foraminis]TCN20500.1 phosphotransferase family enzyme [Mesobacillus foraminis]
MNSNTKSHFPRETIEMIIRENFGKDIAVDTITELTDGWFNAVYILSFVGQGVRGFKEVVIKTGVQESKYVLSYEKNIMHAEILVYSLLQDTIVPVPKILVHDFSKSLVDCDYFIMEKLQGENWMKVDEKITPENKEKLIADIARYTAALHNIKGGYFGYIRNDKEFQFSDWRSAFQNMVHIAIRDGRKGGVDLPYDSILEAFEPLWEILNEVKEPCLVNFDIWKMNIMLAEKDGEYYIDGIIDHERAFYGDPYAEFISLQNICGDVEHNNVFKENYSLLSGKPFTFTRNNKLRFYMYKIYLSLLMGVEVYRYNEEDTKRMLKDCNKKIANSLAELKEYLENS